ncbi:CPBP family intramembrane metalloprotease [Antarcticibacterium arcticum]|uniref:CPBP family intramembrane metalloprotease n=1 Tax=Antarcticibacterium arcticum TaxID=2585771 RepID=A0A5B8YMA4_9FLAO|nr:CPBP family intramembrane glutamic endopeptidase [Antarcticibacterium arcticum]QED38641.1 CPBP family intramembrane metalloprotease [Antarcticibacterium arcticum]
MKIFTRRRYQENFVRPFIRDEEVQVILAISLMILFAGHFVMQYLGHTWFKESFLDPTNPGFWLIITNAVFITAILLLNKQAGGWAWSQLGFAPGPKWWHTVLITLGTIILIFVVSGFVRPLVTAVGDEPDISHLMVLQDNLPLLILALILVWVTAAFLQELVFRAFLINSLDALLGRTDWSPWWAVIFSSFIFGLMHAWQGIGGILSTAVIGFIFGAVFLLNGRRILPLVLAHGILDSISLYGIYAM